MSKNYNIDDILSEVKKRREENENEIINKAAEPVADEPATEEPATEEEPSDNMVDILSLSETELEEESEENKSEDEKPAKGRKTTKIVVSIIAAILVIAIAVAAIFANKLLDNIVNNSKETVATTESAWKGMNKLIESFDAIDETEATELSSLQDMIRTWYYNGAPCSSTHVLNVMLIGEDTRGTKILEESTRADSAIIVSVNIDTKQITLTSILRDAWAYWETTEGDRSTGQFGKINGAMSTADINAYINCVEQLYKIDIDNYVIVNFDSFEGIVDALGGVTLELTSAEINEINNHQKRYGQVTIEKSFEGNKGEMRLNGKQALAYCRIRKLDSDNMRADRQKTCLIKIFEESKDASGAKLLKLLNKLTPYVKTSFGKSELVKIARYALSQGWLDFDIQMQNLPDYRLSGGSERAFGQWIWRPDYPADAYNLQMTVYGKSSITLAHIRVDTKKCPATGFYSEGAGAMSTTITNQHYGEATTTTTTTKKETSN